MQCRSFLPKPEFRFSYSGGCCECSLTLPPIAAFQKIVGPVSRNSHSAKQQVCLEACKKLHQMGALNDHLVPSVEASPVEDLAPKSRESASGAGNLFLETRHSAVISFMCSQLYSLFHKQLVIWLGHRTWSRGLECQRHV